MKRDKVIPVITVHDPSVDPDKVIFKTRSGTEFKREKFDKTTGRYVLNLVGGNANDGQELYALYPKPGGGYYNLGKLLIVSYPSYRIKVKIVPVANDLDEFEALRGELEKIYSRVGIECVVEKMPVFAYSSPLLFADKSGVFSAYTDEMKKLQGAYVENYGIDPEASYLFVLLYSGQGDDRNYTGFMPLNKQFGYLFRRDFGSFEEFAVAAAHELAHGRLSLRHPFDKSLGLPEGSVADNLMDYRHGRELAKWQWDVIHDPGIVLRVFERDEDVAIIVDRNKNTVTIRWNNCQPQMVANKKLLLYDGVCADTKENVTYYRLVNNGGIVAHYLDNSVEVIHKYSITFDKKKWFTLSLSGYQDDCLSCELTQLLGQMVAETGKMTGTYALPAEDIYILVTGEDFDGVESSRIAAGGFLILEVVQVGKVAKLIKGGKILTKAGKGVDISARVIKQFAKKTAEDAVIDLSAQFLFGFVNNATLYPDEDGYEITKRALLDVKLQDAIVAGMINYASLNDKGKMAFDCALKITSKLNGGGCSIELTNTIAGVQDCLVNLIISIGFKHLKGTAQYNAFCKAIQDAQNYDIIIKKLSEIVTGETIESFIQVLIENGIQNVYGKQE